MPAVRACAHATTEEVRIGAIMKTVAKALGWAMIVIGAVWILQGVNVLPGSFMTGHIEWAVYGALVALAGLGIRFWAGRTPSK
jgi:hypothetical protein